MRSLGYEAEAFASAAEFLASCKLRNTFCLIADVHMPYMNGLELYDQLIESGNAIPTILITAYPDDRVRARALAAGIICYLCKSFEEAALLECVRSALAKSG